MTNPFLDSLEKFSVGPGGLHAILFTEAQSLFSPTGSAFDNALNPKSHTGLAWHEAFAGAGDTGDSAGAVALKGPGGDILSRQVLKYRGVPVHGVGMKSLARDGEVHYASGDVPAWLASGEAIDARVRPHALDAAAAVASAARALGFHPWRFSSPERVYLPVDHRQELRAAYVTRVSNERGELGRAPAFPIEVIVDAETGEILSQRPLAFHINGSARIYPENKVATPQISTETLPDLAGDGSRLTHGLFEVRNCDSKDPSEGCVQAAQGGQGDYKSILYSDSQYDEIMAYFAVTRAMGWYQAISRMTPANGPTWRSGAPGDRANLGLTPSYKLNVYVRALTKAPDGGKTADNAQYLPTGRSGVGSPEIVIGTGWEDGQARAKTLLVYLGRDADVTMHEFGHHIVFRALQNTTGQSLMMHEGFADYFTYAITGNNKLGESIMATGEPLRHGNKGGDLRNYLGMSAHRVGEFWSSSLWDARTKLGVWGAGGGVYKFDKIAWEAVDLLKESAQFYDAIGAFAKAAEVFAAANNDDARALKNQIFEVFHARGFIEAPDGSGNLPRASSTLLASNSQVTESSPARISGGRKRSSGWCGVVAASHSGGQSGASNSMGVSGVLLLVLGGVVPLFGMRIARRVSARLQRSRARRR